MVSYTAGTPPTIRPAGLHLPSPATAGEVNGANAAGVGSGEAGVPVCRPPGVGGLAGRGVVVLDGFTVVVERAAGTVACVRTRAVGWPAPHDASAKVTAINMVTRAGILVLALVRGWRADIGPG